MGPRTTFFFSLFLILGNVIITAQNNQNLIPKASAVEVYKKVGQVELKAYLFNPPQNQADEAKPAIIFFFGGGWRSGSPTQFTRHCEYLAARGMVAITIDYRVSSRYPVKAKDCVADAKSAIRWIRKNAARLGIHPNKIVAAGGSAGGHLAASTACVPSHDDAMDDLSISAEPNALALFNPATILAHVEGKYEFPAKKRASLESRLGATAESLSPYHHVKGGMGPCIIFHGTGDNTVAYRTAELFQQEMVAKGNDCTLISYIGEPHGFFNFGKKSNGPFVSTMQHLDNFLVRIGFLDGVPANRVH